MSEVKWKAWAMQHNSHGPALNHISYLPEGDKPETDRNWVRCPWLDSHGPITTILIVVGSLISSGIKAMISMIGKKPVLSRDEQLLIKITMEKYNLTAEEIAEEFRILRNDR